MKFSAFMLSCTERKEARESTLRSLVDSGWTDPIEVVEDSGDGPTRLDRIHTTWRRTVVRAGESESEFVLLLEDDIVFGRWFTENLYSWPPLQSVPPGGAFYGSLYNPHMPLIRSFPDERYFLAYPRNLWGSQALVLTPATARYIRGRWDEANGNPDMRMPRIVSKIAPIHYHLPSLVDHAPEPTTWGGLTHVARDFDFEWRAAAPSPSSAASIQSDSSC